jgi:predicted MFS family arabinose efflux permease
MKFVFSVYKNAFSGLQPNIWILALALFINRSGAMVLLFTSLYLTNDLHFSIVEAGVIMSFFGFGSVLGSYTGGWLTDRRNFYDVMVLALISSGLILLLLPFATSKYFLSAIIFSYAFCSDMFRPANAAAIAAFSTPENRTRSVSLVRLAINLGFSVGPAAGGFIALYLGYKWLYVIDSTTSISAGLMLLAYLPRVKKEKSEDHATIKTRTRSAYKDYKYLFFIFLVMLYAISFFQLFLSVPQYFSKECHYHEDTIGLLLALNGLLVVIIEMPLIAMIEKRQKIFTFIIWGALCIPLAFAILNAGGGLMIWALVYTLVITFSEMLCMPFMMNHALSQPANERQGQYSALYSIAWGLGIILAPLTGMSVAHAYGFSMMFYVFILLGIVTAIGFAFLSKKQS